MAEPKFETTIISNAVYVGVMIVETQGDFRIVPVVLGHKTKVEGMMEIVVKLNMLMEDLVKGMLDDIENSDQAGKPH